MEAKTNYPSQEARHKTCPNSLNKDTLIYEGCSQLAKKKLRETQNNIEKCHIEQPLHIDKINPPPENRYRISQTDLSQSQTNNDTSNMLRIATWNIRGCTWEASRNKIDETLNNMHIDIITLQETHLNTGTVSSEHYDWWTSGGTKHKTTRGVAICIRKNSHIIGTQFEAISDSIATMKIIKSSNTVKIITTHIPSDKRKWPTHTKLGEILAKERSKTHIILAGDMNAHIGRDKPDNLNQWVGGKLYHNETNENGDLILGLAQHFDLTIHNTWSSSNTVLTTWSNGRTNSQIDHILSTMGKSAITHTKAYWKEEVKTDHKLLVGTIGLNHVGQSQINKKSETKIRQGQLRWNIHLLKKEEFQSRYCSLFTELTEQERQQEEKGKETLGQKWNRLHNRILKTAADTLNTPKVPSLEQRKAEAKYQQALFRRHKDPDNPLRRKRLKEMKLNKIKVNDEHMEKECLDFFRNSHKLSPHDRTSQLFKFLKKFKRKVGTKKWKYMPMSKWTEMLQQGAGQPVRKIIETDFFPLNPPPTSAIIKLFSKNRKWGTSPGVDKINSELISEGPKILEQEITKILVEAWLTGDSPQEWKNTIQVPLPKINNPKEITDYRPITLCNTIYKIYTKFLLKELDEHLGAAPTYQAAYIKERSADDHTFVVRRILEERWNQGKPSYVLSIDLTKAFDKVSHKSIIKALINKEVPHYLINRIITTCLHEMMSIQWCGQRTDYFNKSIGIKQGCPISPRLFSLVIDEILAKTAKSIKGLILEQTNKITVPITLAYADDLLFVASKEQEIEKFIKELIGKKHM